MADHKAAKGWAEWRVQHPPKNDGTHQEHINLAAAYLELRELAKAVIDELWDANTETPTCKALRAALGEE